MIKVETTNILKGFVGYVPSDNGPIPKAVCRSYSTAERLVGEGSHIKEIQVIAINGEWYGPVVFQDPSKEDVQKDRDYARYKEAVDRAIAAGLTGDDIKILSGGFKDYRGGK
jgi:hypothetical protein